MPPSSLMPHVGSRMATHLTSDCEGRLQGNGKRFIAKKLPRRSTSSRGKKAPPRRRADAKEHERHTNRLPSGRSSGLYSRSRVSLCMIVRDEESNLSPCLESVADLVDEIVVVDTGSTDRTRDIAQRLGARVFDFPWVDDFSAARNESLRHATGDWIFWIDADERIDAPNHTKIRRLFAQLREENQAFGMSCVHLPEQGSFLRTEEKSIRVFRNHPEIRWRNRIHEDIMPARRARGASVVWTDIAFHHTGYQDPVVRARRNERDLRLLLMDYARGANRPYTLCHVGRIYLDMGRAADALPMLQRGLKRSDLPDQIARGFYRLLVDCHLALGKSKQALTTCGAGRAHYPLDAGLLWLEAQLREEAGDAAGAENCYLQLLQDLQPDDLTGMSAGLVGFLARHRLASVYAMEGRTAEAESLWPALDS